jgi:phenylacetate-CoA ligase
MDGEAMKAVRFLTEAERLPLLSDDGRKLLRWMQEHPNAPKYNYQCGDQLTAEMLARVRAYETELSSYRKPLVDDQTPDWLLNFADRCLLDVPFYRRRGGRAEDFSSLPTCSRKDLDKEQWAFVPDSQSLDGLIMYYTSGTTGKPFYILSHPEVSSKYLVKLKAALAAIGITLEGGKGRVSIITPCAQSSTLTYATVSTFLGEAGFVKLNLNPGEWRSADDAAKFIDDCNTEIFSGDPIAFLALAKLPLRTRPKALVSSAMTLMPALKRELEERFECPVMDAYSMNESRFIAASSGQGYAIIAHDIIVEILDEEGNRVEPGGRGEVTLSCPRNPFMPLLRYRTGDFAALRFIDGSASLVDFEGRQPVMFINTQGQIINNIEVTYALEPFPLSQFSLHQNRDKSLLLKLRGSQTDEHRIADALRKLFGAGQELSIAELLEDETHNGKVLQYTSDIKDIKISESELAFG